MVGSLLVIVISSAAKGKWPSGVQWLGFLFLFAGLTFMADVVPEVGVPLALLVFFAILLGLGGDALDAITGSFRKRGKLVNVEGSLT